jgi:hypothetical protein
MNLSRLARHRDRAPARDPDAALGPEEIVSELYRGLLGREPDEGGLAARATALRDGMSLGAIAHDIAVSSEFAVKQGYIQLSPLDLPNLRELRPERYRSLDGGESVFIAADDGDIDWMERAILEHRYYDSFGVWSPTIDIDKRVTAAFIAGLGPKSCLELGSFTGPVLSLLDERGIDVTGIEISHLAFVLAYPSVKNKIRYGDLLSVDIAGPYDAILAMDILEHLNPRKLPQYVARIADLLSPDGYLLVNSPMFGPDEIFGQTADTYLPEWRATGDESNWLQLHCDARGWPQHGHLIWATPSWWERQFEAHGLIRDREVERRAHDILDESFFNRVAPGRRSFFLLRRANSTPPSPDVSGALERSLQAALAAG